MEYEKRNPNHAARSNGLDGPLIYERLCYLIKQSTSRSTTPLQPSPIFKIHPGRLLTVKILKLRGRLMMYLVLLHARVSVFFFSCDACAMGQANTDQYCFGLLGVPNVTKGSNRDAVATGGL